MSKLIVEMEMPKHMCCDCDISIDGFACKKARIGGGRCPIVGELPDEHGDLIDRDALLETCIYYVINPNKGAVDADNIQDMPVIIAAERKDDEQIH
jgi:hypothetical protein